MAEFPALPLWTDAYLADTAHLSDAECGLYLRILIMIWRAPECRVPNDDGWLRRKLGRSENEFRPLLAEFCLSDGNWITQKRLLKEWKWVKERAVRNSEAAKSRWNKEKEPSGRNASPHNGGNAPIPTPIPTPNEQERKKITSEFVVGKKNGNGFTIDDPQSRLSLFQNWLAPLLNPDLTQSWAIIARASDPNDPDYAASRKICRSIARANGKGLPPQW